MNACGLHFPRPYSGGVTSRGKKYAKYFRALELPEDTSQDNVRRQYIQLVKKYHPDTNGDNPVAKERFAAVDEVI